MVIRRQDLKDAGEDDDDGDVTDGVCGVGRKLHRYRSCATLLLLNLVVTTLFSQSYYLHTKMGFQSVSNDNSVGDNRSSDVTEIINRTLLQKTIITDDSTTAGGAASSSDSTNNTKQDGVTTNNDYGNDNDSNEDPKTDYLPTCRSLMEDPYSPYRDGSFLTRHTIPVSWVPRRDGSRELRHSMCRLHRYSAKEARQCLAGKHVNFIGDSLTRYQYLSLAWFLHKDTYPPRFGRNFRHAAAAGGGGGSSRQQKGHCVFLNDHGRSACSPWHQPNVNMEGDWAGAVPANFSTFSDPWTRITTVLGQPRDDYFGGYMESNSIRSSAADNLAENYFYATPPSLSSTLFGLSDLRQDIHRVFLSFNNEIGWGDTPTPIHGFNYTGCAFSGKCDFPDKLAETRLQRASNLSFDFSQPLEEAVLPDGVLRQVLPPINITIYNRGLWGTVPKVKLEKLMPALYDWSQGTNGRCYFRSSTGRFEKTRKHELDVVRTETLKSGCGFIDVGHLVEDFNSLLSHHPKPPGQEYGTIHHEYDTVYWDSVHFLPWVYEEINNMLLNVLCNNA